MDETKRERTEAAYVECTVTALRLDATPIVVAYEVKLYRTTSPLFKAQVPEEDIRLVMTLSNGVHNAARHSALVQTWLARHVFA